MRSKAALRGKLAELAQKYAGEFGVDDWHIFAKPVDPEQDATMRGYAMRCVNMSWEYMNVCIEYDEPLCRRATDEELDDYMRHEIVHVVLSPIHNWADRTVAALHFNDRGVFEEHLRMATERVTTHLTSMTKRLLEPKKEIA